MALKVIGAGLGRTATFSMKFALEHLGLGPCYHMAEVFCGTRRTVPQWQDVVGGKPDWDALFEGYQSTTDYPACTYWRELAEHFPEAKVVLTVRDADSWFDSVTETIFSDAMQASLVGTPTGDMMKGVVFDHFGDGDVRDRAFMTDWFEARNQRVIDALPPDRLLVYSPKQGWEPLCAFLDVPVPAEPFPRVNSRDELTHHNDEQHNVPQDDETAERYARIYIDELKVKAFTPAV